MSASDRPSVMIDADKSMVKMTIPRLLALIALIVTIANVVTNRVSSLASHEDVEKLITTHSVYPHPSAAAKMDEIEKHGAELDAKNAVQDEQLQRLAPIPERMGSIEAKIDLLLTSQLEENPSSIRRAARKIKAEAKKRGEDDPLEGVDGL